MFGSFFIILPFIASMLYGLGYVLLEKVVGVHVNPATFLLLNTIAGALTIIPLVLWKGEAIELSAIVTHWSVFLMVVVAAFAPSLGWLATIYAIKNSSALYTALAETSYPLFTMAFGFLLFGIKQLNLVTFAGGMLVLVGAAIMIYGQAASLGTPSEPS